jgi:hypothetical protein
MGGKQRSPKMGGYKGVECQDLEKEINGGDKKLPRFPVQPVILPSKINPYRIAGQGKISNTGQSLSILIREEDDTKRYFTILLSDIYLMHQEFIGGAFSTVSVREYFNPPQNQ